MHVLGVLCLKTAIRLFWGQGLAFLVKTGLQPCGREDKVLKLFSVSITKFLYLANQFSIVATRYGSIVVAVSTVTATCLLKVKFSS